MFKCFKFIDDMMKQLNEADEMPMDDDTEMGGDDAAMEDPAAEGDMDIEGGEAPVEGAESNPASNPEQIAEVDNGTFISDLGNAEVAKTLLKAVTKALPNEIIPPQFETVTTDNANAVIQYAKNLLQLDGTDESNPYENMTYDDALKNA